VGNSYQLMTVGYLTAETFVKQNSKLSLGFPQRNWSRAMSDTTDTMPDVIWVEGVEEWQNRAGTWSADPHPSNMLPDNEYVKRSLMDDLQAQLKRRCACEFVDGKCVEPCKYHSELQKRLDETIKAFKELQAQLDEANAAITKAVRDLYARDTVNAYERLNRAAQEVKG